MKKFFPWKHLIASMFFSFLFFTNNIFAQCGTANPVQDVNTGIWYPSIQAAVTAAAPGDVISVCPGPYTENVSITKSLTIKGAQAGVDARGRVAAESIVMPAVAGTATITISFNGSLTIDGFSFSGGTALGVIQTTSGPNNNMQIVNNLFS